MKYKISDNYRLVGIILAAISTSIIYKIIKSSQNEISILMVLSSIFIFLCSWYCFYKEYKNTKNLNDKKRFIINFKAHEIFSFFITFFILSSILGEF